METTGTPHSPGTVSHAELVAVAAKWLAAQRCVVIVTEAAPGWHMTGESPDAIGWRSDGSRFESVVIEVKATRSDFLADARKRWRQPGRPAMGQRRYFAAPAGLIADSEVPDGWGLLEYDGKRLACKRWPAAHEANMADERLALIAACRRLGVASAEGAACRVYKFTGMTRTTVGVDVEAGA